jgi:PAS domain S-box-containing protein
VEWSASPRLPLLAWSAFMLALTSLRLLLVRRFQQASPGQQAKPVWKRLFMAGAALAGLGWGLTMFLLLPESSIPHQVFLVFMLGGITAGAVSTLSAELDAFLCFALPAIAPVVLYFLRSGDSLAAAMAAMIIFFAMVMIYVAASVNRTVVRSLTLQFENAGLVRRMAAHALQTGQAAEALRRSEERYRTLYDDTPSMYFTLDRHGIILSVNRFGAEQLGYAPDDLIGRSVLTVFHDDDTPEVRNQLALLLGQPGTVRRWQLRKVKKDGTVMWVEEDARAVRREDGSLIILVVCSDITKRKETEAALRDSEERYRLLVDQATDIIYRTDPEGRFTFVNPTTMRLAGYAESELLGHRFTEFIRPDYCRKARRVYRHQFVRKTPVTYFEFPALTKDGREIWFGQNVQLLQEGGRVTGFSAVARDITERKEAEERLRRSEAFLTSLIENLPDMIFVKDAKTLGFVRINKAGEDLLGLSREALIGKTDYDFFPAQQADHFTRRDQEVLASGRLMDIPEESIQTTDKGTRILHTKKIPIHDASGLPQFLLGISEDITETKKAERALRESEERFRQLAGRIKEVFWMSDVGKQTVLYVSPAYEEIWGRSLESLYASPRSWVEAIHPDDRERVLQAAMTKQSTGEYDEEYRIQRPDGSVRWIRDQGFPVQDEMGRVYRVAGIARDITELKRAGEALQAARQAREQLARNLHDNIIQSIYAIGLTVEESQSLAHTSPAGAARKLDQVVASLNRVIREVRGYLDAPAGEQPEALSAEELITSFEHLDRLMEHANGVRFTMAIAPDAVRALTGSQRAQVLYVAQEAMSNSLRHSRAKAANVSLVRTQCGVHLEIRDDGVGFALSRMRNGHGGLKNIRLRARKIGANLDIASHPMGGTAISMDIQTGK